MILFDVLYWILNLDIYVGVWSKCAVGIDLEVWSSPSPISQLALNHPLNPLQIISLFLFDVQFFSEVFWAFEGHDSSGIQGEIVSSCRVSSTARFFSFTMNLPKPLIRRFSPDSKVCLMISRRASIVAEDSSLEKLEFL